MSKIQYLGFDDFLPNKSFIVGCDEVGYGALAGPLVVAAVRAPRNWKITGLKDSKKFTGPRKRENREAISNQLLELIDKNIIQFHLVEKSNIEIDRLGVYNILKICYVELFHKLYQEDSLIVSDGNLKFNGFGVDSYDIVSLVKADNHIPTVMAASILAKVYRDSLMTKLHQQYPLYEWDKNSGYWHKNHVKAIYKLGPTPIHRWSYDPVKSMGIINPNEFSLDLKDINNEIM